MLVVTPGLGTLNHTALTLEAMQNRGIELAGVVIGAWPRTPGPRQCEQPARSATAHRRTLAGVLPEDIAGLPRPRSRRWPPAALSPRFGGGSEADRFVADARGLL